MFPILKALIKSWDYKHELHKLLLLIGHAMWHMGSYFSNQSWTTSSTLEGILNTEPPGKFPHKFLLVVE